MLLWLFLLRHLPLIYLLWAIMRLRDKRYLFHCLIPLTTLPLPTPLHLHLSWRLLLLLLSPLPPPLHLPLHLLPQSVIRLDFLRRSLSSTLRVCQRLLLPRLPLRLHLSLRMLLAPLSYLHPQNAGVSTHDAQRLAKRSLFFVGGGDGFIQEILGINLRLRHWKRCGFMKMRLHLGLRIQ